MEGVILISRHPFRPQQHYKARLDSREDEPVQNNQVKGPEAHEEEIDIFEGVFEGETAVIGLL